MKLLSILLLSGLFISMFYVKNFYIKTEKLPLRNCLLQNKTMNCGPTALLMICNNFNIQTSLNEIENKTNFHSSKGITFLDMYNYTDSIGLRPQALKVTANYLQRNDLPGILFIKSSHFVVLDSLDQKKYCYIRDPSRGRYRMSLSHLLKIWNGEILIFKLPKKKQISSLSITMSNPFERNSHY